MIKQLTLLTTLSTRYHFATALKYEYVTCGSVLKLYSANHDIRLHSHDVAYGTGSGQQSVTGVPNADDANSYWQVRGSTKIGSCKRGEPIKCGDDIRLTHMNSQKNLHSHGFQSPLTSQQEVSCFGTEGEGDHLDNWQVQCNTDVWKRSGYVSIYHPETNKYLAPSGKEFGRPISGQMEIVASKTNSKWKAMEGVFVKPTMGEDEDSGHDEL